MINKKSHKLRALVLALAVMGSIDSNTLFGATVVPVNGPYQQFAYLSLGDVALVGGCQPGGILVDPMCPGPPPNAQQAGDPPYTFTLPAIGGVLEVIDAGTPGDRYTVLNFGLPIGTTSAPVNPDPSNFCVDPVICRADPQYSTGMFVLPGGMYSIEFVVQDIAAANDFAYFHVSSVPEPSTILMMGSGLLGVFWHVRRRRSRS